ncbi:hypothetical protein GCM10008098_04470 [Rhodanobacter panaciterrae]|uniref:Uncharacterized protein n=1 Tax=Rhodanobacter panaciterrae TaxID=490572 RepID=A0ABQ2ZLA5_9GAMM|nr:hypothetical protein [Rhodanobacter panaciterrae]GGY16320.1 hypothetical protein GCM10008098_04470 [Rhodanobacter panaciterrae]
MTTSSIVVSSVAELVRAVQDTGIRQIVVSGELADVPTLRLSPGQVLQGHDDDAALIFATGIDGLQLTTDNEVHSLHLVASSDRRAIHNDTQVESLGRLVLGEVTTIGQVQILARDKVRSGHVEVAGLDVVSADARAQADRPQGFGVHVLQGAFTLWNMQADAAVVISARLVGLSAGRAAAPVLGSGIFVSGAGFEGGRLTVSLLETGEIHSDGRIAPGTPDMITGGVFTVFNAFVDTVRNLGPVVTYGQNDMVLDNWGSVDHWVAEEKITSYGPSGIGFVNFGLVNELEVEAPIETFGQGARGFNVYAGTVNRAVFDRITTHADGAVGIQISQPIGYLSVRRGLETFGGTGDSLVKGVVLKLSAIALSVKPGGSAREIDIDGGVTTHGDGVAPLEMLGVVGRLSIEGGVNAKQTH